MARSSKNPQGPRLVYDDQTRLQTAHQSGDREAMALALLETARSIVRSKASKIPWSLDFEDLAQEATVEALNNLATFDPAKGTLRNYVYGSVRFTILDRSRKEIRRTKPLRLGLHRFVGAY